MTNPTHTPPRRGRNAAPTPPPPKQDDASDSRRNIVSVRFSQTELDRIQAAGLILELSPNEIIRRASEAYLNQLLDSKEYEEALTAYRKKSEDRIAVLEGMRGLR
jgi:hypothetical protein